MQDFLMYDLKVAVLIAVFYMFYRLLLAKETFHRVNRVMLLATSVLSFVLPLCVITLHKTVLMPTLTVEVGEVQMAVADGEPATPWWQVALPILYIIGVAATLGHTLLAVVRILLLIRRSEQHRQPDGITLCVTEGGLSPFSWMHYIVMNRRDYAEHDETVLAHERGHIRLHHSWDVLLVDTLTALQWFNPAMWMLRQDLRAIHEYEADSEVLSLGFNARQYQYLLIMKAAGIGGYSIANGISHSTLKNRIRMMLHKKSSGSHLLKLLALVPIVGAALALNARTVTDVVYNEPQKKQIVKKGKKNATVKTGPVNELVVVASPNETTKGEMSSDEKFVVKGYVYDADAKTPAAIIGAVVTINGSKKGTVTDAEGKFQLEAAVGDKISVSYVGFETTTIGVSREYSTKASSTPYYYVPLHKDGSDGAERAFDVVEQMPQFPGGPSGLMQYLSGNIRYPEEAYKNKVEGRVICTFVVEKNGSISEAHVVKSVSPELDAEAVRVVSTMPNWEPGRQNGEPVRVKYTVPLSFKLQGDSKPDVNVIRIGPEHKGKAKDVEMIIDGKVVDVAEINAISPDNIESIKIDKAKDGMPKDRIIITMKKKQ